MDLMKDTRENYEYLLKDAFNTMLTAPNTDFVTFFNQEKLDW